MPEKLSAIVPTFNNEAIIRRCLSNLTWCDELLVVDSYSQDRTVEIAREYGARIIQHEYINSAKQKNWAIPQASHDWILLLDSDEELEEGFREEVRRQLEDPPESIDGYRIFRKNLVYGRWVRSCGFYPDSLVRLFRKNCRYEEREVHAHIRIQSERTGHLEHHIIHHDFTDLDSYLRKLPRYIRYEGDQLQHEEREFRLREITLRPVAMFLWAYFYKQGFRDGLRGFFLSYLKANYNFFMYWRLWEMEQREATDAPDRFRGRTVGGQQ